MRVNPTTLSAEPVVTSCVTCPPPFSSVSMSMSLLMIIFANFFILMPFFFFVKSFIYLFFYYFILMIKTRNLRFQFIFRNSQVSALALFLCV